MVSTKSGSNAHGLVLGGFLALLLGHVLTLFGIWMSQDRVDNAAKRADEAATGIEEIRGDLIEVKLRMMDLQNQESCREQ